MKQNRKVFKDEVFKRDNHKCVVCDRVGKDAHHIMDRSLFEDGGYDINNGVTVCHECHLKAERGEISPRELRRFANIHNIILPNGLSEDVNYDKWGKPISSYFKYPRTFHIPGSNISNDDKVHDDIDFFVDKEIVITEKMDGENFTMYNDYCHARSLDSESHPSQSWIRNYHNTIKCNIPNGWRVCGEYMYATHAIEYDNLKSYFLVFSIWDEYNECLSWQDTQIWCELLELELVPVIYKGRFSLNSLTNVIKSFSGSNAEGFVIRLSDRFKYENFSTSVAKWVRSNHVSKDCQNWRMNWDKSKVNKIIEDI